MRRFETVVDFYRYREPYPPEFFSTVAAGLSLTHQMTMLDVGCGPGNLAIGFAPFTGRCTAIDLEPQMLRVAREVAGRAKAKITYLGKAIEDLDLSHGGRGIGAHSIRRRRRSRRELRVNAAIFRFAPSLHCLP